MEQELEQGTLHEVKVDELHVERQIRLVGSDAPATAPADTISGFRQIAEGKCDELPEQAFYMVGTFEEAREKAEKLAMAAAAQAAKKAAEAAAAAAAESSAPEAVTPEPEAAAVTPRVDAVDAEKAAKMATIQAAMERAKAQREAAQPKNTEALTAEQQRAVDDIEARRAVLETAPRTEAAPASEKAE